MLKKAYFREVSCRFLLYYFGCVSKNSGDKINFAYIVIQFDPYKKYFPGDDKFSSSFDDFANKFKKICGMNNEFNNKNL